MNHTYLKNKQKKPSLLLLPKLWFILHDTWQKPMLVELCGGKKTLLCATFKIYRTVMVQGDDELNNDHHYWTQTWN